jgi:putative DNA primase/helicase
VTDPKLPGESSNVIDASAVFTNEHKRKFAELTLILSDKGQIKPCEFNVRQLLSIDAKYAGLHFDEFLYRTRIDGRDWTDHDDRNTLCSVQALYRIPGFTLAQVRTSVMALAFLRKRDSLRDFIESLPEWDKTPRIELAFCEAWGAPDTPLVRAASRNFFIAMIARGLKPGEQVDTLWVFEGAQGKKKSMALRALGGHFHAEISAQVGTADFQRELRGLWLAELSEMDSLRGREASTIKRLLSAPSDRFVEKYEKHATSYLRRCVAAATTNEAVYWQDSTGARRLVPIKIGVIDIGLIEANRLQWFGEARQLYTDGATWWVYPAAIEAAQEERQQVDPWEDLLRGLIANGRSVHVGTESITGRPIYETKHWPDAWVASAEIMAEWLKLAPHQQGASVGVRLGRIMRRLGFKPARDGKRRERGWEKDTQGVRDG